MIRALKSKIKNKSVIIMLIIQKFRVFDLIIQDFSYKYHEQKYQLTDHSNQTNNPVDHYHFYQMVDTCSLNKSKEYPFYNFSLLTDF